jgi:Arc/MetJ-type ribon-helix-helix transcriptional regulator
MSITLAEPLEKWVREQAEAQGLKDADAYVSHLVREDQRRHAKKVLLQKLEEGRASGYVEMTDERWDEAKQRVKAHFEAKKTAQAK